MKALEIDLRTEFYPTSQGNRVQQRSHMSRNTPLLPLGNAQQSHPLQYADPQEGKPRLQHVLHRDGQRKPRLPNFPVRMDDVVLVVELVELLGKVVEERRNQMGMQAVRRLLHGIRVCGQ